MKTLPKEKRYETLSYLPPLSDQQIARQVQYMMDQGYIPGIEFEKDPTPELHHWTLWKLPFSTQALLKKYSTKCVSAVVNILTATSVLLVSTTSSSAKPLASSFTSPTKPVTKVLLVFVT